MKRLSAIALLLGTAAAPVDSGADGAAPVALETTTADGDVVIRVIGRSETAAEVAYTLEVASGARSGNRSVQRGRARLVPGPDMGLLTVRLAGAARDDWSVTLRVQPATGPTYTLERKAADGA